MISRKFAAAATADDKQPWYDNAWLPVIARNVTAIVIALLVLIMGVRPLAKALMKRRDDTQPRLAGLNYAPMSGTAPPAAAPVSLDQLQNTRGYDDRIGMVRGFTRDNPARAALAVRDMIKTEAR